MSQRKADKTKSKSGRKKLTFGKETLKDLGVKDGRAEAARGAAAPCIPVTFSWRPTNVMCD